MSPAPAQLGPYIIDRELGRGGMGVVYLGHDTRLDRRVAVKALPEHLAQDPDRLARFEREARTLAQLNHPNVAGIHGVEEDEGARYLILEYVEGETLADRLDRGSLPMDEAVQIAGQIAAGVEAAHEAGVIHRDLKPGNVIVTPEGQAKVLDFGLARVEDASSSSASAVSEQPTLTSPARQHSPTMPGVLLGTAAYMSPEQARGRRVDKRTDIWSFGVILYEMLTGHGPFLGETVSDSIGAILHKDADLDRLPKATPQWVRRVLRRCLERDPAKRLRDIGDAALELADARAFGEEAAAAAPRTPLVALGTLLAGLVIGAGAILLLRPASPVVETSATLLGPRRFSIELPESAPLAPPSAFPFGIRRRAFEISPDGRTFLYTALVGGRTHLYTREMATGEVRPVPGGGEGFGGIFSPDGREIAFFAEEKLFKLGFDRPTNPEPLAETNSPGGIAWASDGMIYFSPMELTAIRAVATSGGTPAPMAGLDRSKEHRQPHLVPDERAILYSRYDNVPNLYVVPLDRPDEQRMIVEFGYDGRVTTSGHLLFMRRDRLMATRLDPSSFEVTRDPITVCSNVRTGRLCGQFLISGDGTLIYEEGPHHESSSFVWLDREGHRESIGLGLQDFVAFALSPDGRRLATPIRKEQHTDIWIYDLERPQTPSRVTFGGVHNCVTWSSDGRYVLFGRYEADGTCTIRAKDVQSGAPTFTIYEHSSFAAPLSYHGPAQELLFVATREESGIDLMRGFVDLAEGDGATLERIEAVSATRYGETFGAISPDRKWMVANSDETGRWEVYLSSYPDMRNRIQISTSGGEEPIWTGDGAKVIYRWNDTWFEVDITTEPALEVSTPRAVASGPYVNVPGYSWDMTADGERFLFLEGPMHDTPTTKLQVVTNFLTELERLLPAEPRD